MKRFFPYLHYLKPVKKPFIVSILLGLIFGLSSGFGLPMMIHLVFPKIFNPGADSLSLLHLISYTLLLPAAFLVRGLSSFFNMLLIAYSGAKVLEAIRLDVFHKLQILQLDFFTAHKNGDLLMRMNEDTETANPRQD